MSHFFWSARYIIWQILVNANGTSVNVYRCALALWYLFSVLYWLIYFLLSYCRVLNTFQISACAVHIQDKKAREGPESKRCPLFCTSGKTRCYEGRKNLKVNWENKHEQQQDKWGRLLSAKGRMQWLQLLSWPNCRTLSKSNKEFSKWRNQG